MLIQRIVGMSAGGRRVPRAAAVALKRKEGNMIDGVQEACSRLPTAEEIERRIAATERPIGLRTSAAGYSGASVYRQHRRSLKALFWDWLFVPDPAKDKFPADGFEAPSVSWPLAVQIWAVFRSGFFGRFSPKSVGPRR
jgi:hypothetical protein